MRSKIGYTLDFSIKEESKKDLLLPLLCLALTTYSITFSCISAFDLPFKIAKILIFATLYVAIEFSVFAFLKRNRFMVNSLIFGTWVILAAVFQEVLLKGVSQIFSFISETIEQSQDIGWDYQMFANYDTKLMELAFIAVLFPIILMLAYSLVEKMNIMIWFFVIIPIFEPMVFFNQLPSLWAFAMLIVAGVMALVLSNLKSSLVKDVKDIRNVGSANVSAIIIATTVGLFLIIVLLLVNPNGYNTFLDNIPGRDNAKTAITETLSPSFEEKTPPQGGITGGDFSKTDQFSFTGETALVVEADKLLGNLYIRGFVGGDYTSKGWKETDLGADKSVDIIKLDNMELSNLFHAQKRNLKITLGEAAEEGHNYEPYFVLNKKGDSFEYLEVANYDNNLFLLSKEAIYNSLLNSMTLSKGQIDKEMLDKCFSNEEEYYKKVKSKYLDVPKSAKAISEEYGAKASNFSNIENAIKYVMGDLSSRANYTLSPGATPENKDFVTYFLYENQKGYCTHFASTAVLIFRSMGIPARYVEGYVVNASDYTSGMQTKDDKYLINVKDTASHAWCEVYLEGCGWMPVEVTPGLTPMPTGDLADAKGDSIEYECEGKTKINEIAVETPKLESQEIEESSSCEGGAGNGTNGKGAGALSWLYKILEILISIMLIVGLIGLFRYLSLKKWNKVLEANNKKISILGWFKLFKKVYKDDEYISLIQWAKEKEDKGIFDEDSISYAINVVQKTAYSNIEEGKDTNISDEEYEVARRNLIYCIVSIYEKLSFIEKVKWILILRLPLPKKEYKKSLESKGASCDT